MTEEFMTEEITPWNAIQYLVELFAKAGKVDRKYRTNEERLTYLSETGAQTFKRRALGLCGHTSIKSLDEIAKLFVETNIASSIDEAESLVPKVVFANKLRPNAISRGGSRYMAFDEVKILSSDTRYRITAWWATD